MPISLVTAGARTKASKISVLAGSLRPLRSIKLMASGELRTVFSSGANGSSGSMTATSSGGAYGYASSRKPSRVQSNSVTVTPNGGSAPYTYSWSIVDGDTSINITAPAMATTAFAETLFNDARSGTARCIVTDAFGNTAAATVALLLQHDNPYQEENP